MVNELCEHMEAEKQGFSTYSVQSTPWFVMF